MENKAIERALEYAVKYGGIDGAHHKDWVIDQMVRALTNCPVLKETYKDATGKEYEYEVQEESEEYKQLIYDACYEDGEQIYGWEEGIPP